VVKSAPAFKIDGEPVRGLPAVVIDAMNFHVVLSSLWLFVNVLNDEFPLARLANIASPGIRKTTAIDAPPAVPDSYLVRGGELAPIAAGRLL